MGKIPIVINKIAIKIMKGVFFIVWINEETAVPVPLCNVIGSIIANFTQEVPPLPNACTVPVTKKVHHNISKKFIFYNHQ